MTVTRNGRKVDAVAQITKTGYVYVLDRKTGEPLFPIEYRKVPASTVDGERLSEMQPYPVKPPPFARQGLTEDMLTTRTPEAHAAVLDAVPQMFEAGCSTPPSLEGTIVFPGLRRRRRMGRRGVRSRTALLFVNSNEMPWIVRLIPNNDTSLYNSKCATLPSRGSRPGAPPRRRSSDIGDRRTRRGDRGDHPPGHRPDARRFPTWARGTSTTSSTS